MTSREDLMGDEQPGSDLVHPLPLPETAADWRQLVETLPHIVWITRPDGWHEHFNQQWTDFTGLTLEESLGDGWNPPFHPDDRDRAARRWATATLTGEPYEIEYRLRRHDGVYRWMLGRAMPLRDEQGRIVRWFGTCTDIDDLKRTQDELERSEAENHALAVRLSTTLESITDAFCTVDAQGRFTYLNQRVGELLVQDRDHLLGRHYAAAFGPAIAGELDDALRAALDDRRTRTLEGYHYPPLDAWFQINIYPSDEGLAVYFRDVSEQHRAQAALQERVKELRALATISGQAHEVTDAAGLCRLTARSLGRAMQNAEEVGVRVQLGDAAAQVGELGEGVRLSVPISAQGSPRGVIEIVDASGRDFLPEEWDLVGSVAETLALWDRHNRATDELRRVNDALADANTELAIAAQLKDDLLSMASHELRTPLTPILGFLELLETHSTNLTEDQRQMLRSMHSNARRMLRLVEDLLVISRAAAEALASRPEDRDAGELIRPVVEDLGESLGGLRVELDLGDHRLVADPQQVQQIVTNLLTNAAKYGASPAKVSLEVIGDGMVRLQVADQGPGVSADFRDRMWDRFVQKDRGDTRTASGTGLGLAIVKLLAEANGGWVGYHDHHPGAAFTVDLPGYRTEPDRSNPR